MIQLSPPPQHAQVGQPMPPFALQGADGKPFDLAGLRGKLVVLNIWTPHTSSDAAVLQKLADAHQQDGKVAIVNVGFGLPIRLAEAFTKKEKLPGIVARVDPGGDFSLRFTLSGPLPQIMLVSPGGTLLADSVKPENLEQTVAAALAKNTP